MIRFGEVTALDCMAVARRMRERDWREISAVLGEFDRGDFGYAVYRSWQMRGRAGFVVSLDGEAVAVMTALSETPTSVQVAMYGSDKFKHVALAATRHVRRVVAPALVADGVLRAECRCWEEHHDARGWLRLCGAREEAVIAGYGKDGETFIQMAWRPQDVYRTESA